MIYLVLVSEHGRRGSSKDYALYNYIVLNERNKSKVISTKLPESRFLFNLYHFLCLELVYRLVAINPSGLNLDCLTPGMSSDAVYRASHPVLEQPFSTPTFLYAINFVPAWNNRAAKTIAAPTRHDTPAKIMAALYVP